MAVIDDAKTLTEYFNFSDECKIQVHNYFNNYKEKFLRPILAYLNAIKIGHSKIIKHRFEHPKSIFYIKTSNLKIVYRENLEIIHIEYKA